MLNYYKKQIQLAQVDQEDKILGQVERWTAHQQGILHRGFTAVVVYKDQLLLQHRKHLVFDKTWDLTISSHPAYVDEQLESDEEAITLTLEREMGLPKSSNIGKLKNLGRVYYKADDPHSQFVEHEVDHLYRVEVDDMPKNYQDFAYEYKLVPANRQALDIFAQTHHLAPWVTSMLDEIAIF